MEECGGRGNENHWLASIQCIKQLIELMSTFLKKTSKVHFQAAGHVTQKLVSSVLFLACSLTLTKTMMQAKILRQVCEIILKILYHHIV